MVLPKDLDPDADLTYLTDLPDSVEAPVAAGQELGAVTVLCNGEDCASAPLLAAGAVPASRFLIARRDLGSLLSRAGVQSGLAVADALILRLTAPHILHIMGVRPLQHAAERSLPAS